VVQCMNTLIWLVTYAVGVECARSHRFHLQLRKHPGALETVLTWER
jgi:hypothetical protein